MSNGSGLNHIAITVSDRERSAAFYAEHFGLDRRVHDDEHLLILKDDHGGLLALTEGDVPADLPKTNHFGSQLSSTEAVSIARRRFSEAGIEELEWQDDGPTRIQVADPDGYRVELYAY